MLFGENILKYRDEILRDIGELVKIPSCAVKGKGSLPYGEKAAQALHWILNRAQEMGLQTVNVDNFAGHAEYGQGEQVAAVLTHVDVVPAGEGWTSDPFTAVERNGKLYGRGVADDKGAAVVALYCLKALQDANVQGVRRLRTIFGSGEEVGMEDIAQYMQTQQMPVMAFTPDSDYGICNREKGILHIELSTPTHDGTTLTEFHAGTVANAVPDKAVVLLDCTEAEDHQLMRLADAKKGKFEFSYTIDGLKLTSYGKASHAMAPEKGFNAATHLIRLLASNFSHVALGTLLCFLDDYINVELKGQSLGIQKKDSHSGPLTVNVGVVDIVSNTARAVLDIRYPVTADGSEIVRQITHYAQREGVSVRVLGDNKPLFVKEEEPIIGILKQAYQDVTGKACSLYATGGGTYARALEGKGVAFGPVFEGQDYRLHNADEFIDIDSFLLHAQICLEAMYRMLTQE